MNYLKKLPGKIFIGLVLIYQRILSPSVGVFRFLPFYPKPSCIFYPTCSEYGKICFEKYPFHTAIQKTINRIIRCHGRNEPKVDLP